MWVRVKWIIPELRLRILLESLACTVAASWLHSARRARTGVDARRRCTVTVDQDQFAVGLHHSGNSRETLYNITQVLEAYRSMDDFAKIRMLGYETVPGPGERPGQDV